METQTVSYTTITSMGETHKADQDVDYALNDIIKIVKEESKWLYLDGVFGNVDTLTKENLLAAKLITLMDKLEGG